MAITVDTSHSQVSFAVRHMMFAKVRGSFPQWTATLSDENGKLSEVAVDVQTASVDTRDPQRDGHLRSPDFFDAENHPMMSFRGKPEGDQKGSFKLVGDLSIRGVSKPVSLDVEFLGAGKDPWGNTKLGYHAKTAVNRKDFGLNWNAALELGGVLVGDMVEIEVDLEAVAS